MPSIFKSNRPEQVLEPTVNSMPISAPVQSESYATVHCDLLSLDDAQMVPEIVHRSMDLLDMFPKHEQKLMMKLVYLDEADNDTVIKRRDDSYEAAWRVKEEMWTQFRKLNGTHEWYEKYGRQQQIAAAAKEEKKKLLVRLKEFLDTAF